MRLKAALTILALLSCGMNFSPASLCAFHCGWSGQDSSVHDRQRASQTNPEVASSPTDDEHQNADCTACISNLGISFNRAADCLSAAQMDMLAEAFFSFAPSRVTAAIDVAQPFAGASDSARDRARSWPAAASGPNRTSVSPPVPLRI
jgi:hypothetical protein